MNITRSATGELRKLFPNPFPIFSRKWHSNPKKIPYKFTPKVVPTEKLKFEEPVSGSLNFEDIAQKRKFLWDVESLNAKGFLRIQKSYDPPSDAKQRVLNICHALIQELDKQETVLDYKFKDLRQKYDVLKATFKEFSHCVPNSMLYMTNNIGDVVKFYETRITCTTPFQELVIKQENNSLPENVYVQKQPIRFHPETDNMFGGISAFPKSSTIVTGLRSKKKYKGFEAKRRWP